MLLVIWVGAHLGRFSLDFTKMQKSLENYLSELIRFGHGLMMSEWVGEWASDRASESVECAGETMKEYNI